MYFHEQYAPRIQSNNTAFVHHMLVYGCKDFARVEEPECFNVRTALGDCTEAYVLGGWAIGGEVMIVFLLHWSLSKV